MSEVRNASKLHFQPSPNFSPSKREDLPNASPLHVRTLESDKDL